MKQLIAFCKMNKNLLRGLALIAMGMGIANFGWSVGFAGAVLCIVGFVFIWINTKPFSKKKHKR